MKPKPKSGATKEQRKLSPAEFIDLVELMPKKAVKGAASGASSKSSTDDVPREWIPVKWKKGWFAANLNHVNGKVEVQDAEKALGQLLLREDGLEEYALWLMARLARPRDAWVGFAQHFGAAGFFSRVYEKNSGKYREIARGKESSAAEEQVERRLSLLKNAGFASGVGSEVHLSDSYVHRRFGLDGAEKDSLESVKSQNSLLKSSNRASLTRQLVAQEFTKIPPAIKDALSSLERVVKDSLAREIASDKTINQLGEEIKAAEDRRRGLEQERDRSKEETQTLAKEKQRIEDTSSDAGRRSRDRFDRLRLSVADDIERLLKVALEVAKSIDDPKKSGIVAKQIEQVLLLGEDLRDADKAAKRGGG